MTTNAFNFTKGQTVYYRHPVHGYRVCTFETMQEFCSDEVYEFLKDNTTGAIYFIDDICEYDIRTQREYMIDYFAPTYNLDIDTVIAYCDKNNIQ